MVFFRQLYNNSSLVFLLSASYGWLGVFFQIWVVGKHCISGVACSTLLLLLLGFLGAENYCICSAVFEGACMNTKGLVGWLLRWMDGWKEHFRLYSRLLSHRRDTYVYEYDRLIIRWISS